MKRIFKYPIRVTDEQRVMMPSGAKILSTGYDPLGQLCLWALVDAGRTSTARKVIIHGTGHPADDVAKGYDFVGTVIGQKLELVWHVFIDEGIRWDNR